MQRRNLLIPRKKLLTVSVYARSVTGPVRVKFDQVVYLCEITFVRFFAAFQVLRGDFVLAEGTSCVNPRRGRAVVGLFMWTIRLRTSFFVYFYHFWKMKEYSKLMIAFLSYFLTLCFFFIPSLYIDLFVFLFSSAPKSKVVCIVED